MQFKFGFISDLYIYVTCGQILRLVSQFEAAYVLSTGVTITTV